MIVDQIRTLATPIFLPSQFAFRCNDYLGFESVLNLEETPPLLCVADGDTWHRRPATDSELETILAGLHARPSHLAELSPLEILARFTGEEQDAISSSYPRFARLLFSTTAPVAWSTFAGSVTQLHNGGLLDSAQVARILGPQEAE